MANRLVITPSYLLITKLYGATAMWQYRFSVSFFAVYRALFDLMF